MKVVINACFGGFGLSDKATQAYSDLSGAGLVHVYDPVDNFYYWQCANGDYWRDSDIDRASPALVAVVEQLGAVANGACADLLVIDIAPGTQWRIIEYDGNEHIEHNDASLWRVAT